MRIVAGSVPTGKMSLFGSLSRRILDAPSDPHPGFRDPRERGPDDTVPATNLLSLLLPALAGLLLFCCFPRISQGYLAWFALTPLICHVARAASKKQAFLGGFICGVVAWFGLLVWIPRVLAHYGGVPQVLAWFLYLLMVAFLSLFPAAASLLTRICIERSGARSLLVFPFAWVAFEYLRNYFPFGGFPWLLIGYSQTSYSHLIQIADATGVYGVSFMLLWMNTALAWFLLHRRQTSGIWPIAAALLMIGADLLYGRAMLRSWDKPAAPYTAAMLQENLSFDEPEPALARKFQEGYPEMASLLPPGSVDLLILPESPSPLTYQHDASYREAMNALARDFSMGMIFNNISYDQEGPRYFNSAYFLNGDGLELGRYDKIRLVPFGEYVPLRRLFFFVDTISKDVSDFSPGREYLTVEMDRHKVNAIICFEAIFPDLERRFARAGSELIVNLTNDGWYGNSAAPYQHLAMSRWRAVENRRYLLRATNSGISAIIDPTGGIRTSTPLLQEAICRGGFGFVRTLTFYTRYGDLFAILCAIIMFALLAYSCLLSTKRA